ncbi:MAG: alanine--tRNA ligase, partial [Candidatus Diapherotrites archaeon]|nr:alanine--tRNA ligase [Candidatus Diapherotrites archaeon]
MNDKELKVWFKKKASKEFDKFYPAKQLKEEGFYRNRCKKCGKFFWSVNATRELCGDASCIGGYKFINNSPMKKRLNYIESWLEFKKFFERKGYTPLQRYPVVARWRNDVYWVAASIYPFQPWVVLGQQKPKANPLVIPQLSLRFNDIDNVGITGSHYVCFDMLGQHRFEPKEKYKQEEYWQEYYEWITKGMKVDKESLVIHEDAWAGAGFFGPCMEFFSMGLEIGNQVYMQYMHSESGNSELKLKVLDMGQGHERIPWLSYGKAISYETTFPTVIDYLKKTTGIKPDMLLIEKFQPYAGLLNMDEVENIEQEWGFIAKELGVDVQILKEEVTKLAAIYSIAEHSRAALVALHDGALPSNVGGGYNLRVILRRMFSFIENYSWDIDFAKLFELHARFLKPLYPELLEEQEHSLRVLDIEHKKFLENRRKAKQIVERLIEKEGIDSEKLIELYNSHGVQPEQVASIAKEKGIEIEIPADFYARLSEIHKEVQPDKESKAITEFEGLPETEKLYWQSWQLTKAKAKVLAIKDNFVVLDKTIFYPTSGGQLHDTGKINNIEVINVFKQNEIIVHELSSKPDFKVGDTVSCVVDFERRKQLTQHHTAAHLINAAARQMFGKHVWQGGAAKSVDRARLDITHYKNLDDKERAELEQKVNELINKKLPVIKEILPREKAEEKYGLIIYQGGAVPGRELRIVSIDEIDHEACGGTHVDITAEIE